MAAPRPHQLTVDGLSGKRAVVTGAGRGIGFAIAELLLASGARVAVLAQHKASAREAVRRLGSPLAFALHGDLADPDVNQGVLGEALERLGGLDILVNNAGWTLTTPFLSESRTYWDRVLAVNLRAVILACGAALPALQLEGGAIVNIVSDAGRVGMQGEAVYAAAKGGVIAFTKSIAQETARKGVRANCVSPGPTRTRVLAENLAADGEVGRIERLLRRIPLRRAAEPAEVAQAAVFLASDLASHITGQVLSVSGGLTMV